MLLLVTCVSTWRPPLVAIIFPPVLRFSCQKAGFHARNVGSGGMGPSGDPHTGGQSRRSTPFHHAPAPTYQSPSCSCHRGLTSHPTVSHGELLWRVAPAGLVLTAVQVRLPPLHLSISSTTLLAGPKSGMQAFSEARKFLRARILNVFNAHQNRDLKGYNFPLSYDK